MAAIRFHAQVDRGVLALALALVVAAPAGADAGTEDGEDTREYRITLLPSLGGTGSRGNSINERGWVSGYSVLPGDANRHAVVWRDGRIIDLGTLGNPDGNSNVALDGMNNRGTIVGISQTADPEPDGEEWSCSAFFQPGTNVGLTCRGFVRENGELKPIPTFGGNNGFATGINSRGQVAGWAENRVEDPTCVAPQVFQFRAFVWEPGEEELTMLPPLGDDTSSAATAINERGQVVGISGICDDAVGKFSAMHAVMWDRGRVIDLGSLGGISWHTPWAVNNRGDVVGFSNPPGDDEGEFIAHAFIWTKENGMEDLEALEGDAFSQAQGINDRGQVVGVSFGGQNGLRAFLWEKGKDTALVDLNTLAPDFDGVLLDARDVNQQGQITGYATDPGTGETRAFIATPLATR